MRTPHENPTERVLPKKEGFAAVLHEWLVAQQLTPGGAAPVLGVSFQTVYLWLAGVALPPGTRIPALARVLGVPAKRLARVIKKDRAARKHAVDDATATVDAIESGLT